MTAEEQQHRYNAFLKALRERAKREDLRQIKAVLRARAEERREREEEEARQEAKREAIRELRRRRKEAEEKRQQRKEKERMRLFGSWFESIMEEQRQKKETKWLISETIVNNMMARIKKARGLEISPREEAVQFLDAWKAEGLKGVWEKGLSLEAGEAILLEPTLLQRAKDIGFLNGDFDKEHKAFMLRTFREMKVKRRLVKFLDSLERLLKENTEGAYFKALREVNLTQEEIRMLGSNPTFEKRFSELAPAIAKNVTAHATKP